MGPGSRPGRRKIAASAAHRVRISNRIACLRVLATCVVRALNFVSPSLKDRGRREDRVRAAPAVSCAIAHSKTRTRAYRFSGSIPAFPAQWLYGLLRALPSERLFCHCRRARREPLRSLTPAPRRQDHTTSPYASCAFVLRAIRVHRISPRVRDDGQRPSSAVRRADSITDLPDGASGIFLHEGMDRLWSDLPGGLICRRLQCNPSLPTQRSNR
jgi:hypothetical protein